MTKEQQIKKLSDLRAEALKNISEYNRLAKKIDFTSRLGLADAEAYYEEEESESKEESQNPIEDYVNNTYGEHVGVNIDSPDAGMWFPSSICPGF